MSTVELQMRLKCNYVQRFLSTHTHTNTPDSQFRSFENVSFKWKQWECDLTMDAHLALFHIISVHRKFVLFFSCFTCYWKFQPSLFIRDVSCAACASPRACVSYWVLDFCLDSYCLFHRYQPHEIKTICARKSIDRKIDINFSNADDTQINNLKSFPRLPRVTWAWARNLWFIHSECGSYKMWWWQLVLISYIKLKM